ncbi:MAG: hypothetical protein GX878_10980 [Firmicutes bacterium]|nr:hypothetical protein [Bacillota bacterium]
MTSPAVLLGADLITLGAYRTLGRHGIKVYALSSNFTGAYALSSRYIFKKILIPDVKENEEALADFLIEFGKQFSKPPVLMASSDSYAIMISRYAEHLAKYFLFPDNPPGLLEAVINKKSLYSMAMDKGLSMPKTLFPGDGEGCMPAPTTGMNYPCIVKPSISEDFVKIFRQKCLVVNNAEELEEALKQVNKMDLEVMVQEIIPGFDDQMYMFDVYIDSTGRATHTFLAQKLRQFPINFGSSTLAHHCHDRQITDLGLEFFYKLGYRGFGEIEFKKDPRDNHIYMIEINARLSRTNALLDAAGTEFAYIIYRDLLNQPLPEVHFHEEKPWAFYFFYEDIFAVSAYRKSGQLAWKEILRPWFSHRKAHAIWAGDDIGPFFSFVKLLFSKLADRIGLQISRFLRFKRRAG